MAKAQKTKRSYLTDGLVLVAMALVSSAVGTGLILQQKLDPTMAGVFAVVGFMALATMHILLRRTNNLVPVAAAGSHASDTLDAGPQLPMGGIADASGSAGPKLSAPTVATVTANTAGKERADGIARREPGKMPFGGDAGVQKEAMQAEEISRIIKRLADDITSRPADLERAPAGPPPPPKPISAEDFGLDKPQAKAAVAAKAMASAPPPPPPSATAGQSDDGAVEQLAAVADALANEQLDVFLEPIHGLNDGMARHYEVTVRLSMRDGQKLAQRGYTEATRGTVLLPLIDAVKVSHSKKIGMQLLRRGKSGALISEINGESVSGSEFGDDLAAIMGPDRTMAGRLVLSFSQYDVRAFGPAQWSSLDRLQSLGFRFAVNDVTDLDLDFESLAQKGFTFAKLDADIFLNGLQAGELRVSPNDICRYLAAAGLTLVVDHLRDDRQLAEVLGFGALFGQGTFFGGPRPVKAHVLRDNEAVSQSDRPHLQAQ
ncbi:MAG: EAL domain-containing protein [Hyphomicrobiaceae bacterium]